MAQELNAGAVNAEGSVDLFGNPAIPDAPAQQPQATQQQGQAVTFDNNVMDDLFDFGEASQPAGQPAEGAAQAIPGNQQGQAKQTQPDEQRFQYWQSQADRARHELEQMRAKYEPVAPLVETLQKRPELLDKLGKELSGELPPEKPAIPANYNKIEALNNPDSDSWKYREALESYNEKRIEFIEKKEAQRIDALQKQQQAYVRQMQAQEAVSTATQQVQQKYGWDDARTERFMKRWSSGQSLTVDFLAQVDNLIERSQAQNRQGVQQQAQQRNVIPLPLAVRSTARQGQQPSDEQEFNNSFFNPKPQ